MSGWGRIKRILTLTCREAAELSSARLDEPLGWTDRLAWAGHLLVCGGCRRFRRQLEFLRAAVRRAAADVQHAPVAEVVLSDEARARIAKVLHDARAG